MDDKFIKLMGTIIQFMSRTIHRERLIKLAQYVSFYLHHKAKNAGQTPHSCYWKVYKNVWIVRKSLRFGLVSHYIKPIIKYINEQSEEKNPDQLARSLEKLSEQNKKDANDKNQSEFPLTNLPILSNICSILFCVSDYPFFFKEANFLKLSDEIQDRITRIKHIFWLLSLAFTIANEWINLKYVNMRVQAFKEYTFAEQNADLKQSDKAEGKIISKTMKLR